MSSVFFYSLFQWQPRKDDLLPLTRPQGEIPQSGRPEPSPPQWDWWDANRKYNNTYIKYNVTKKERLAANNTNKAVCLKFPLYLNISYMPRILNENRLTQSLNIWLFTQTKQANLDENKCRKKVTHECSSHRKHCAVFSSFARNWISSSSVGLAPQ